MTVRTQFPERVTEIEDLRIPLPDGTRLSARVWMPADAASRPVPAVLEYIPYRKRDGTLPRDELMHPYVAGHGYACVRVDIRGNGDSEGLMEDEYSAQELQDACDVIAWLSRQDWCSGSVGMMGKSWGGFNCLQTAFLQPPALKAVISVYSTTDRFADDIHFKGGALLGENFGWGSVMLSYSSRPPDPLLRNDWREDWLKRLEAEPFHAPGWASHQSRDAYWKHGSICEDWDRMTVPILSFGGWNDNYMNTVAALMENARGPVKGIIGPWVHQYPHTAVPGPKIGFLQLAIRWWDRWLKGVENGAEDDPAFRAYMLHSAPPDASAAHRDGHWIAEAEWPTPRVSRRVLPVSDAGLGVAGPLSATVCTSQHLGMTAGEFFPMGLNAEMAGDQRGDDALSVCFDGAALAEPLELLGAAKLSLRLASDKPLAVLVARLCDVAPDGASTRIAHGILNLCQRRDREQPEPMPPGVVQDITLTLDQMCYRLAAGHRLRLALSTTYWPFVWPSLEAATLSITSASLDLPVHQGTGEAEWLPPPAETATPWKHRPLRQGQASRRIETDLIAGRHALVVEDDQGDTENLAHGLVTGETTTERWEIGADPLSARAGITWEQRLSRGDWQVRTQVETEMTATADDLRMRADLTAWEGDRVVFKRHWDERVKRKFV
ncbi:MAG: CocE/NonD family hydrolase [Rhodobacterales bacterium]|nr:CocE/NonD family hydrolase [Rhodobacterales bacterium]